MNKKLSSTSNPEPQVGELLQIMAENLPITEQKVDQECQVNFYSNSDVNSQTFINTTQACFSRFLTLVLRA